MQKKFEFGVTIVSDLELSQLEDVAAFNHVHVLDLRRGVNGKAMPIEEAIVKRLSNLWVVYEQMPTDLHKMNSRQENALYNAICEQGGSTLVITNQVVMMGTFCMGLDIPFVSSELYLVETGSATVPVQVDVPPAPAAQDAKILAFG